MSIRVISPIETPKPRSRKLYVLWGVALTLLISTALFCWLVVVPIWRTHRVVSTKIEFDININHNDSISQLGGQRMAAARLGRYLRLPGWLGADKMRAVSLLEFCGPHAMPILEEALQYEDIEIRIVAFESLCQVVGNEDLALLAGVLKKDSALVEAIYQTGREVDARKALMDIWAEGLADTEPHARVISAFMLGNIGPKADRVIPALERLLKDENAQVRQAAAAALKKIKAAEPAKK